jgi:hypothetical protein
MDNPTPASENVNPNDVTPPSIPTPASEPQIVTPTPVSETSSSAVSATVTAPVAKEAVLKPWEMATLVLVAVALIWCGMGMKHAKKPVAKPAHRIVEVVKKATPKVTVKAVIKVKPAKAVKKSNISHKVYTETRDPGWKKWGPKK